MLNRKQKGTLDFPSIIDKAQGALIGLALGDALGTTLEFKTKDSYPPLTDMVGGGPFRLKPGQWTDDTSMMLCLADSLLAVGGHNASDQMKRYCAWWKEGHNSVNGRCFDIGNTVSDALQLFSDTNLANAGSREEYTAGNGSLMRLAPVAVFYSTFRSVQQDELILTAKLSSITTHAEPRAVQACQIMAWLMGSIFNELALTKERLFTLLAKTWDSPRIHQDLREVVGGSFATKTRKQIRGSGFVVHSLEAALWSFANSDTFEDGALLAANLGEDADTTAAIYGQLAGAYYGYNQLPESWLEKLAWREEIRERAILLASIPSKDSISNMLESIAGLGAEESFAFQSLLYDHGCILTDYRWMNCPDHKELGADIRLNTSDEARLKRHKLESFNYTEGLKMITAVVRGDRFCEGLWRLFVEDGSLQIWLNRMAQLTDKE